MFDSRCFVQKRSNRSCGYCRSCKESCQKLEKTPTTSSGLLISIRTAPSLRGNSGYAASCDRRDHSRYLSTSPIARSIPTRRRDRSRLSVNGRSPKHKRTRQRVLFLLRMRSFESAPCHAERDSLVSVLRLVETYRRICWSRCERDCFYRLLYGQVALVRDSIYLSFTKYNAP